MWEYFANLELAVQASDYEIMCNFLNNIMALVYGKNSLSEADLIKLFFSAAKFRVGATPKATSKCTWSFEKLVDSFSFWDIILLAFWKNTAHLVIKYKFVQVLSPSMYHRLLPKFKAAIFPCKDDHLHTSTSSYVW